MAMAVQSTGASSHSSSKSANMAFAPGITVPGSESNQSFQDSWGFPVEPNSKALVLRLRGQAQGKHVSKPLTVSDKLKCSTCGKAVKATSQFCPKCGTATEII